MQVPVDVTYLHENLVKQKVYKFRSAEHITFHMHQSHSFIVMEELFVRQATKLLFSLEECTLHCFL